MMLSILIPVIPQYSEESKILIAELNKQKTDLVEIIYTMNERQIDGGPSTGQRRQELLLKATGKYIVFIDADDFIPDYYVEEMLKACESGADCFAINGIMTTDGKNEVQWFISKNYENKDIVVGGKLIYQRHTNHITGVKREIALRAGFPNKSNAEDKWYSDRLILNSEHLIEKPMYWYRWLSTKRNYK